MYLHTYTRFSFKMDNILIYILYLKKYFLLYILFYLSFDHRSSKNNFFLPSNILKKIFFRNPPIEEILVNFSWFTT